MRNVVLGYLLIQDFKSFKGKNEIILSVEPGLKYVSGTNDVAPRLGSNGAGKTTIWDAVFWCWTGYSIRGHRASDLASWGTKSPQVVTGFSVDGVEHYIERSGVPNRLYIDGVLAEQEEVDAFLLSRKRLLHSVFFGQGVDFFIDLSVAARGELLDEVMDLDLWVKLSDIASKKATAAGTQLAKLSNDLSYYSGQYGALTNQELAIAEANATWETDWRTEIDADTQSMKEVEAALKRDQQHRAEIARLMQVPVPEIRQREYNETVMLLRQKLALCQDHIARNDAEYAFLSEHETCPTCQQQITAAFRRDKFTSNETTAAALAAEYAALTSQEATAVQYLSEAQQADKAEADYMQELRQDAALLDQRIAQQTADIKARAVAISKKMMAGNNPFTAQLTALRTSLNAMVEQIGTAEAEAATVKGAQIKYDYWRTGFRRLRLYQVKQVLDYLQLETANAASALGIGDWAIEYSTEVETKSGTMKSGVHITVKAPDGTVIAEDSGGEGQRVRLSVSMGFSQLIQSMAGIHFGFECWDEPSAWLSAEGIDDLLDQLKDRAKDQDRSIWLLDHNVLSYPDFAETWNVRKTPNGSIMAQQHNGAGYNGIGGAA